MTENDFEISILLIKRNSLQFEIEQIDELLNKIGAAAGLAAASQKAPAKAKTEAVQEVTFTILKFEPQKGAKLGDYDVAFKENNLDDKFRYAFNILRVSNATIKDRYHGEGYQYSFWIYGENKIYRQRLKGA